ncbi:hypothetical protein KTT56_10245 [Pseudomonas viridiflava]|uniref:hypothetical protein n=1 Tax=Pseudomonas syringae group TaxID=136849 RepID=UPI001C313D05|nr:hypothetical protein [Pseudomonas viridiflava]MCF8980018.1 hypothetical protein [Pseudomonas syringae]QXG27196.1 hypothetical protein KTT56_10245 [Pseudomonas viridiflava]
MNDLERYQDSAQGRRSIRQATGLYDDLGNLKSTLVDYCHDYKDPVEYAAARAAQREYRKKLARRINAAITKMEMICPPKGASA